MITLDFGGDDPPHPLPALSILERFRQKAAASIPLRGDVSILLTSDKIIRRLNRDYRHKNKPTDVLSFPAANLPTVRPSQQPAGDIAISVDTAQRQANALGHSLTIELKVLLLHGMLHLAGFDHEHDTGEMAHREQALRRTLRLPHSLIERSLPAPRSPQKRQVSA